MSKQKQSEPCRNVAVKGTQIRVNGWCHRADRIRVLTLIVALATSWSAIFATDPQPLPELNVTETTTMDALDAANMAPGGSDVPVGGGAAISSFNGNLQVSAALSTVLPQDGKLPSLAFGLTYNGTNVRQYSVREGTNSQLYLSGRSWVGLGWTGHLGRIFRLAKYHAASNDYSEFATYFEFPNGSHYQFEPSVWNANPDLKIEYFRDCPPPGVTPDPPPLCSSNLCQRISPPVCCEDAGGDPVDLCANRGDDRTEHYHVTFPNGTRYRLEKIVPYDYAQPGGWIRNHDRAGYYTTGISDRFGNSITVDYARSGPFPEAITAVHSNQHPAMDLTTTRCVASDPDPLRCPAGTEGMLKEVVSVSFQGSRSEPQHMKAQLSYGIQTLADGGQSVAVPVLSDITFVGSDEPQEVGGTTHFKFGVHHEPFLLTNWWGLQQIRTPLGAVLDFGYSTWRSGSRLIGSDTADRLIMGVIRQTTFPEGLGVNDSPTGKPFFVRSWNREFGATSCSPAQDGTNLFEQIAPDGRRTTFTVQGDVCGRPSITDKGPFGVPDTVVVYQGNPGVALRTRANVYDFETDEDGNIVRQIPKNTESIFNDDQYTTCFETPDPSDTPDPKKIVTDGSTRQSGRWQDTVLSSPDYMRAPNDQPVTRHDQAKRGSAPPCADGKVYVRGLTLATAAEEGTGLTRIEENATWSCNGELLQSRVKDEWRPAGSANNLGLDPDDLVRSLSYFPNGNLQQSVSSGRALYPDNTTTANSYTTTNSWTNAQVATQESPAVTAYKLADATPDIGGQIWKRRDSNGLETAFDYDALGRLKEVDPPGSVEHKTRTIYDSDLRQVRVITSAGEETAFDPEEPNQLYSQQEIDQLGRVVQVWKAMPDKTMSTQITRYDQFNRAIFVSEWLTTDEATSDRRLWSSDVDGDGIAEYRVSDVPYRADGRPWGTVTFYGTPSATATERLNPLKAAPDGLGRVRRVERADGSVTEFDYCGPHVQTTIRGVQTGISGSETSDAVTRQYYDALGRIVLVDAPTGSADAEYSYDTRGKLTRVNLVTQLPANPMDAWKNDAIPPGQIRLFKYDAAGRLVSRQTPEKGTELFGEVDANGDVLDAYYDALGNPLVRVDALGAQRGYFFKTLYDSLGRATLVQKVRGTPVTPITSLYTNTLGVDGGFPSGGAWVEGTINGNIFEHPVGADSYWTVAASGAAPNCRTNAPSSGLYPTSGSPLLYFGNPATCTYSNAPAGSQAIRHAVSGVTRDDVLTFKYWRQVRQSTTPKDAFQVYVVMPPPGSPNDVTSRRVAFKLDSAQASFSRWQQSPETRLGDLFTSAEWPEGVTKTLDIYFVFDLLDTTQAIIGGGIAIDDVFVGRESWIEASYGYDGDVCQGAAPSGGDACNGGDELSNHYKGRLVEIRTYDGLRTLAHKFMVYKGLNGRLSGENTLLDWAGDGVFDAWATRVGYTGQGDVAYWTAPYEGLTDVGDQRRYDYTYKRGFLDGLTANGTVFVQGGATPPNLAYTAAGSLSRVKFGNGAETNYAFDVMQRPASVTVKEPAQGTSGPQTVWSSGDYTYDGGSNIASIGTQRFAYDAAQRLVRAQMLPQATSAAETTAYDVTSDYDAFGNMLSQDWHHGDEETPPPGFDFDHAYGGSPSAVSNRVQGDSNFVYDLNGALLRAPGATSGQTSMLWDSQGRLSTFYNGTPEQLNRPTERYAYDAGGFRLVRWPESGDGRPVITLRAATGRTTTEFTADPTSTFPKLTRENVFLGGMQIADRVPVVSAPLLTANTPMYQNGTFGFRISGFVSGATYSVDVRTAEGFENHVGGVSPTSTGVFWIPESALISGQRNWVSVRREAASGEPYSNVVVVNYDTNLTSQDPNQVRAVSVSRSGSKTFIKWNVLQENGKSLLVYFHQDGAEEPVLLTPQGLAAGTASYMILDQSMGSQCGHFNITQATSSLTNETAPSSNANLPPSGPLGAAVIFEVCDWEDPGSGGGGGGGGGLQPPSLLTSFHHRDHLGNLRVLTDIGGWKFDAHDYYPFGREIEAIAADLNSGTVNRYTGHERDVRTGLDYMVMRSKSINYPFFASPDLIDVATSAAPHSWNKYAYVAGNPLTRTDPSGLLWNLFCKYSDCGGGGYGFWGFYEGGYRPGGGFGGGWEGGWSDWGDWMGPIAPPGYGLYDPGYWDGWWGSGGGWNSGGSSEGGWSGSPFNADADQSASSDAGAFFDKCNEPWMMNDPEARAKCKSNLPAREGGWNGNLWGKYSPQDGICSSMALLPLQPSSAFRACCIGHDSCFVANECNQTSWGPYLSNVLGPLMTPTGIPFAPRLYSGCTTCDAEAVRCVGQAGWQFFMGSGE